MSPLPAAHLHPSGTGQVIVMKNTGHLDLLTMQKRSWVLSRKNANPQLQRPTQKILLWQVLSPHRKDPGCLNNYFIHVFAHSYCSLPFCLVLPVIEKMMKMNTRSTSLPMQKLFFKINLLLWQVLSLQRKVPGRFINHFIHFLAHSYCSLLFCLVLLFIEDDEQEHTLHRPTESRNCCRR